MAAVHLVTNHISAGEPARIRSRRSALDLLSSILTLRDEMRSPESASLRETQVILRELISLVRVLSVSGHLSLQNAETLVEALDELGNFLTVAQRSALSEGISLGRDELLETDLVLPARERLTDTSSAKRRGVAIKDKGSRGGVSDKKENIRTRTERIVGILTTQGQLGIKDIVANLPEYSEKMIQRELKGLVARERVRKSGSKRWSTYALAQ